MRLDVPAKKYAMLLNDPCYSDLVCPVYSSGGSGNFVRVESDFILGAEATSVGAAIIFTPGLVTPATGVQAGVVIPSTVVNSDTGTITWSNDIAKTPGYGMASMFGSTRAIAACLQVSYVGSEQTRAGIVSLCQTSRDAALSATSVAAMRSVSQRVVRMPDGVLEVKLAPFGDSATFLPCETASTLSANQMPSLAVSVSGIPASTGVRFRLVQVLEWMPRGNSGALTDVTQTDSSNTLTSVLSALHAARPEWQYELLTGLGAYAAKAITFI